MHHKRQDITQLSARSRAFSGDPKLNRVESIILAAQAGLGKTWTAVLHITILAFYPDQTLEACGEAHVSPTSSGFISASERPLHVS